MPRLVKIAAVIVVIAVAAFLTGPRPEVTEDFTFNAAALPDDLDRYLAASEKTVPNLRQGQEKTILWADSARRKATEFALVYLHGFSASRVEIAPVPQTVARAIGANLFMTRLAGHGRNGPAMAEARLADWLTDTAEAIAIGGRIGEKTILIAVSTGGTLATFAAARPALASRLAGLVLISPNYAIRGASTGFLNMPWAETVLPLLLGAERSFEPVNSRQAEGWTTTYPISAIFPMAALLKLVSRIDHRDITLPALFIYSTHDKVVVPQETTKVIREWGGATEVLIVNDSGDPRHHVLAGDIVSPGTNRRLSAAIIRWIKALD